MKLWRNLRTRLAKPAANEDGAVLIFFGLMVLGLLVTTALAVDIGAILNARSEAQRAADAAALAGAGVFMKPGSALAQQPLALDSAKHFASLNYVGRWQIDPATDVDVTFPGDVAERRVGVVVRGRTPSLFSSFFGIDILPVRAYAEARASPSAGAKCVKPFALPDLWHETTQDANNNRIWEPPTGNGNNAGGEPWMFDPNTDVYQRFTGDPAEDVYATGYGSAWRNGYGSPSYVADQGRLVTIKAGAPSGQGSDATPSTSQIYAGNFFAFKIPSDGIITGGGGSLYRQNIANCNQTIIDFETEYDLEPGNMAGPTNQGLNDLIGNNNDTFEQAAADPEGSPRAIKVALYDPVEVQKSGKSAISLNNIVWFYVDDWTPQGEMTGRFMFNAEGVGTGEGSTVKTLQLIR